MLFFQDMNSPSFYSLRINLFNENLIFNENLTIEHIKYGKGNLKVRANLFGLSCPIGISLLSLLHNHFLYIFFEVFNELVCNDMWPLNL